MSTRIFRELLEFFVFASLSWGVATADEKQGMPDLMQVDNTCLPTSTANLMIWFSHHGYPKLLLPGDNKDDQALHTIHRIMKDTDARFDWGTRRQDVTSGIEKYIHESGYDCDVEYRGLNGKEAFQQDWLKQNDDPNKGFILLLNYVQYHPAINSYSNACNFGHAVTLVNAEPDMILIHDPAHWVSETGRKILTPQVISGGNWMEEGARVPMAGLILLSGSLLDSPPNSEILVSGAVCVTMHPIEVPSKSTPVPTAAGGGNLGGTSTSPTVQPAKGSAPQESWLTWAFDYVFRK